jgi:hypothetical protein
LAPRERGPARTVSSAARIGSTGRGNRDAPRFNFLVHPARKRYWPGRAKASSARNPYPGPGPTPDGTGRSRDGHDRPAPVGKEVFASYQPASVRRHRSALRGSPPPGYRLHPLLSRRTGFAAGPMSPSVRERILGREPGQGAFLTIVRGPSFTGPDPSGSCAPPGGPDLPDRRHRGRRPAARGQPPAAQVE